MSTTIFPKNEPTDLELIPPSSVETQHPGPPSPASASPVGSSSAPRAQEPQNPRYSKLYFDPSSEKAVRLSSDLINRTLEVPDLFTTDISLATHILVSDLPSALGDKLIRARTALSVDNGSRFPQVLTLSWIEESLRLKHWQPEEGYYYVPAEVKREEKQGPFVKREGREDVELDFEEGARERREEETSAKVEGFVTDTAMKSEIATEGFGAAGREEGMDGIKKEGTATQSTLEDDASLKTSNVPILVAPALAASSNAPARSRWTAEEEQQLVRHLARPGGKLITKFKSFHAEHPSRSVGAIDSYHRTYRVRIEAAVKALQDVASPSSSSSSATGLIVAVAGPSSSSSAPLPNTSHRVSLSFKRPAETSFKPSSSHKRHKVEDSNAVASNSFSTSALDQHHHAQEFPPSHHASVPYTSPFSSSSRNAFLQPSSSNIPSSSVAANPNSDSTRHLLFVPSHPPSFLALGAPPPSCLSTFQWCYFCGEDGSPFFLSLTTATHDLEEGEQIACAHCFEWGQYWLAGGGWKEEKHGGGDGKRREGGTWEGMSELERLRWATRKLEEKGARDRSSLVGE